MFFASFMACIFNFNIKSSYIVPAININAAIANTNSFILEYKIPPKSPPKKKNIIIVNINSPEGKKYIQLYSIAFIAAPLWISVPNKKSTFGFKPYDKVIEELE